MSEHEERLSRALESLEGLSIGDALGESLSYRFYDARNRLDFSVYGDGSVRYTDDTEMAIGIVEVLNSLKKIHQDTLAWKFASRYRFDPHRGYGKMARRILEEISAGLEWKQVSSSAFGGGSFGNGAAMRVAPLGAYFADDINKVSEAAALSAQVTHFHPEGVAGAIAVAVSAAVGVAMRGKSIESVRNAIWDATLNFTPSSEVKKRIELARGMKTILPAEASRILGNGAEISAQDTVPFCIWSACRNLDNYQEALLETLEVGGDCDTNCAIVCGIVAAHTGTESIPNEWKRVREALRIDL